MHIEKFIESLTTDEKCKIYHILQKDIPLRKDITILDWLDIDYIIKNMSMRLIHLLHKILRETSQNLLLSELTWEMFIKVRGGGNKSWAEFEEFRNHYFSIQ